MPNWKNINKTNYKNFIKNHSGFAILTGNINNITGIDIDDRKVYDEWLVEYPDLSDHLQETNKGVHIYFEYCETLKLQTLLKV
jgi:phosphoribosylformylglycinamidine (FGAM) synthase-like enzyme